MSRPKLTLVHLKREKRCERWALGGQPSEARRKRGSEGCEGSRMREGEPGSLAFRRDREGGSKGDEEENGPLHLVTTRTPDVPLVLRTDSEVAVGPSATWRV